MSTFTLAISFDHFQFALIHGPDIPGSYAILLFTASDLASIISYLNAEFQRIARRDKKALFSNQCKEVEENNRMGKTRDLFKKTRDTKGTFHAKMGSIKNRNGMDLTEAEDIKKRWQEYTEELYKKKKSS